MYPPILNSTQSAFAITEKLNYNIDFTLQNITSSDEINHIQIRIVEQKSNKSIVKTKYFPDGIIYLDWKESPYIKKNPYSVTIFWDFLEKTWQPGTLYKVQLRFGSTTLWSDIKNFATWKKEQIDNKTFSEWSTVMVIKAIETPVLGMVNSGTVVSGETTSEQSERTTTPLFQGTYSLKEENKEPVKQYQFELYQEEELLEKSDWIPYVDNLNYRFKHILTNQDNYTAVFSIQTQNGYEDSYRYNFQVNVTYLDNEEELTLTAEDDVENGSINIFLSTGKSITGCYVLSRACEDTNYSVYENIKYFNFFEQNFTNTLLFTDYVVESGIKYKYAIQYENSQGLRSNLITTNKILVNYEYAFLYRDGLQLKLQFNQKMSSFKHSVLNSKQDTLGGKYPHLMRNGRAYYAEFPVNGLISFQMDDGQTFFNGNYYQEEEVIPEDKFAGTLGATRLASSANPFAIDSNITDNNIFIERKFREKVEEFLNTLDYKLYKSPTEGNIVIGLMNVSLSPEEALGRMLFNFSATAYEVMENTLDNLIEAGIVDVGFRDEEISTIYYDSFGQLEGLYNYTDEEGNHNSGDTNLQNLICQQEEVLVGDEKYKLKLDVITSIRVEAYPDRDLEGLKNEAEADKTAYELELLEQGKTFEEIEKDKEYLVLKAKVEAITNLMAACENIGLQVVKIKINGKEILVQAGRVYQVEGGITELELISAYYPIILNYTTTLQRVQNDTMGIITAVDTSKIWGQISGIFTQEESILQIYKYYYGKGEQPYRVYSDKTREWNDTTGRILLDYTNYNVYKTTNIYEIIKEEARKQVECIYKDYAGFSEGEDGYWVNTSGTIRYKFSDIISVDIEADPYSDLYISSDMDGKNKTRIFLGTTGRYTLNPIDNQVRYISFIGDKDNSKGTYALINYKVLTSQTIFTYDAERSE